MTLTDPREALAEQSNFIGYLMGLASLGRVVRELAADGDAEAGSSRDADDFVHVLLGVASLGDAVEGLAESTPVQHHRAATSSATESTTTRWLR